MMMRYLSAAICMAAVSITARAGQPYNFEYRVTGSLTERPTLIFNDGVMTYVEIPFASKSGDWEIVSHAYTRQGPYLVIQGTPNQFIVGKGKTGRLEVVGAPNPILAGSDQSTPEMPKTSPIPTAVTDTPRSTRQALSDYQAQKAKTEKAAPESSSATCFARPLIGSHTLLIAFPGDSASMSKSTESELRSMLSGLRPITSITFIQSSKIPAALRARRLVYLMGIASDQGKDISIGGSVGKTATGGTEVLVVRAGASVPCGERRFVSVAPDGISMRASGADLMDMIREIALLGAKHVVVEGSQRPTPVTLDETSLTEYAALTALARTAGAGVSIVLRDQSIIVRFKETK